MNTSIGRKVWVALTGLFLCLFLVVHLAGNLTLLLPEPEARAAYNAYSAKLASNPVMEGAAYGLYATILAHIVLSAVLVVQSRRARGPQRYAYERPGRTSPWYARRMGLLGIVLTVFLVVHMRTFWVTYTFGDLAVDAAGHRDLYSVAVGAFARPWYVAFYVFAMAALGLHLLHGASSAARTLGLHGRRYGRAVVWVGRAFALVMFVGFATLPIWMFLTTRSPT